MATKRIKFFYEKPAPITVDVEIPDDIEADANLVDNYIRNEMPLPWIELAEWIEVDQ